MKCVVNGNWSVTSQEVKKSREVVQDMSGVGGEAKVWEQLGGWVCR